jgi:hypothetical protein
VLPADAIAVAAISMTARSLPHRTGCGTNETLDAIGIGPRAAVRIEWLRSIGISAERARIGNSKLFDSWREERGRCRVA